ncbi:MAG: hypothetical protein JXJ04_25105 [Spirochaetales bacterium]|nr:hypothetical protein [Spirochaetales bacterium]
MKKLCVISCLLILLFIMSCEIPDTESPVNPMPLIGEAVSGGILLGPGLDDVTGPGSTRDKCLGIASPKYYVMMEKASNGETAHWNHTLSSFYSKNNDLRDQGWRMYGVEGRFFDCNGTKTIYSGFYKPSTAAQKDFFNYEFDSAWQELQTLREDGWRLFLVDGFTWNGKIRFNFSMRKTKTTDWEVFGWYYKDFQDLYNDIYPDGWKVKVFDVYYVNGKLTVNASFTQGISDYQYVLLGYPVSYFKSVYNSLKTQGWRLYKMDVDGSYVSAVFLLGSTDQKLIFDCSESNLKSKLESGWSEGYRTKIFDSSF